ncbi:MAG: Ig-like domain repeat protein [Terracidiphilus sp.]
MLGNRLILRSSHDLPEAINFKTQRSVLPWPAPAIQPARKRRGVLALAALLLAAAGVQAQSVFPNENLGVAVTQTVTVTGSASLTGSTPVATVEVLTNGFSGSEFAKGSGTCDTATLSAGGQCTESVTFTPAYPGKRTGAVVLLDASSNVLGTAYISGVGVGGLDVLTPGNVVTVAGEFRAWTSTQDGIPATQANVDQPSSIAFDGAGNLYIADSAHNKVRMVCATGTVTIAGSTCPGAGIITTVAGTGNAGYTGDNGPAKNSTLSSPNGISIDGAGNLYIADTANNVVRMIAASTGIITTVAGDGTAGFGGDGHGATAAGSQLNVPVGVTVDAQGDLYIADLANQRIRRVDAVSGIITTAAGNGNLSGANDGKGTYSGDGGPAVNAGLSLPYSVAFDLSGNMYIPDSANNRIRLVKAINGAITPASTISTVVGTGNGGNPNCPNGAANAEGLTTPSGVAIDPAGNIYVSDTQDGCIRKTNITSGEISTIAINGSIAVDSAGVLGFAQVYAPIGIVVDGLGNVFYADFYYMIVDEIESDKAVLNFTSTPVRQGDKSTALPQIVENDGNAPSELGSVTPDSNAAVDATSTTCVPPYPFGLGEDADCIIGGIFAPSISGNPVLGNIDVVDNTVNTPLDFVLAGDATAVNSTTISLTASPNPAPATQVVTFTATVSTGANTGPLTGTVTFSDTFNGTTTQIGSPVTVNSSGVATQTTGALAVGVHVISATYNGDATHFASQQPAKVTLTIYETTKVVVTAVPASPSQLGTPVTSTATVSIPDGGMVPLDGTVTFTDSLAALGANTVPINNGVATYTTGALLQGMNVITATYTPNTSNLIQGSAGTLNQDVVTSATVSLTSSPNPSVYGGPVTFTVTVPDSASLAATGNVNIVIVPVGQSSPTYPLTVSLSGNPATGTGTISTLPVGSYNATATYAGDSNFASATGALSSPQVVSQVQTTTALAATPAQGIAGNPMAITATVTPASGTGIPTGTVTFTDTFNGATVTLGSAIALTKTGTATINPAKLAPGTHSILATYAGDTNDAGNTATLSLVVVQATTTTTVTATPSPATVQGTITFTAVVTGNGATPTGTVSFLANGSIALGTGTLDGAGKASVTYSALAAGSYQITAIYSGDTNDAGSTSAAITEVVGLLQTTTDLGTASTTGANSQTILISTVQDSGNSGPAPTGTVTFTSGTNVIGTAQLNADGVATLTPNLGAGNYTVIASYQGDTLHGASQSSPISITTVGSSFNLTVTPAKVSMATSQNATVTVTLNSVSGFTDNIGLGCGSLPAGVNCHFSNISLALAANGTSTAQLMIDTNNPLGGGASAMNKQPGSRNVELGGILLPFSMFMGWILWRFRKRHASVLSTVLLLVLSAAAMLATGCIGFTQSSAAPGTYTIQVVGVGANSNVTEYQNVALTITQ